LDPKNHPYNAPQTIEEQSVARRKMPPPDGETFGKRLAHIRKAAGYSQYDLADETKISQRMIAYYETTSSHPPLHLFPVIAKALGVPLEQLLGLEKTKAVKARDTRLWRRFLALEKLPPTQRRHIVQYIDTFLDNWKSKTDKA
jgi:transcriptional regulator with XRE-family HTH domain